MRSRIFLGLLFGAAGGFLGYLIQERAVRHDAVLPPTPQDLLSIGAYVGMMLGLSIGAVEGAVLNSPRLVLRGMLLGFFIGAIGGMFGIYIGGAVYNMALMGHDPSAVSNPSRGILDFTHEVIARAMGWTFLGAFPGLAAGAATLSRKRAIHGLAGGLLGGFLGGFVFDLVATTVTVPTQGMAAAAAGQQVFEAGGPSRAIGFTLIGALTGLFIGLVEELLKQAWVRVLAGRNEGKDYIVSKPLTVLGRDERADIPLFGDPSLAPQHAAIRMESRRHMLLDGGTPLGAVVNGQRVQQQQLLRDGDMIQLGQVRLLFREKATATKVGRPLPDQPKSATAPGAVVMPENFCPFCGAQKDPSGQCLCTVPGSVPTGGMQPGTGAVPDLMSTPMAPGYGGPDPYATQAMAYSAPSYGGAPGGVGSRLVVLEGVYAGQIFPIGPSGANIGRDAARDIALTNDVTVSRAHSHIGVEGGQHVIYDDGSSNGTYVNNVRVTIQTLAPGDVIQLGASKFRYE